MARINFSQVASGSSRIRQFMNFSWSGWSYTSTHAMCTLYIQSGGVMSGTVLYPSKKGVQMQMSALCSYDNVFSNTYVISSYKNLWKSTSTSPLNVYSDLYANGLSGSYQFSFNIQNGGTSPYIQRGYIFLWSAINNLASASYQTNTVRLGLPGGYSIPYGTPTGRTSVYNITQTSATREAVVGTWGNFATGGSWTWYYGPGNYNISSGGSTTANLYNLSPSTTYTYRFVIRNNGGKTRTITGSFRTLDYTPPSSNVWVNSVTNNSLNMGYSTWGSSISQIRVYLNGSLWTTLHTTNSNGTFSIGGLSPKTSYYVSIQAYTPYGNLWGGQTGNVWGTTYPNPVWVSGATITELLPFNARVTISSNAPGDTNLYGFTLLDNNKNVIRGETTQGGSSFNYTGLTPEISYYARLRVRTSNSNIWSGYYDLPFTTPPDQATVFLKVNNVWRRAKVFIKIQGTWVKGKNLYVRVNGAWRKNNNF